MNEVDILDQIEAIRARALAEILALGLNAGEVQVDVSIQPVDPEALRKLAEAKGWPLEYNWYEPEGDKPSGCVTLYLDGEVEFENTDTLIDYLDCPYQGSAETTVDRLEE